MDSSPKAQAKDDEGGIHLPSSSSASSSNNHVKDPDRVRQKRLHYAATTTHCLMLYRFLT